MVRTKKQRIERARLKRLDEIRYAAFKSYCRHTDNADKLRKIVRDLDRWEREVRGPGPLGLAANFDDILTSIGESARRLES